MLEFLVSGCAWYQETMPVAWTEIKKFKINLTNHIILNAIVPNILIPKGDGLVTSQLINRGLAVCLNCKGHIYT